MNEDIRKARLTSFDWNERMAVPDLDIEAALYAYVPGGSSVWCWLPQADGWTPHQTAYDVMRAAIAAVDKCRANRAASDSDGSREASETQSGSTEGDSAGRETASPNADRTPA